LSTKVEVTMEMLLSIISSISRPIV